MALEYLLEAARNRLRLDFVTASLIPGGTAAAAAKFIEIEPDGHPPANMAEWFIALDEIGVSTPGADQEFLEERYQIGVWITKRTGKFATDRQYSAYSQATSGLRALERATIKYLHKNQLVRTAANTLGGFPHADYGDSFVKPLFYAGRGKTVYAHGEWNGSAEGENTFLVRQLRFVGGDRIQAPDIQG